MVNLSLETLDSKVCVGLETALPKLRKRSDYIGDPVAGSRVQAVIDGQGLALWDELVAPEFEAGTLVQVSETQLESSRYYVGYPKPVMTKAATALCDWIKSEASYG